MANLYVKSGAGGAATGTSWTDAFLTLLAAVTAAAAGDSIWVSNNHSEAPASGQAYTFAGTAAAPNYVTCVLDTGSAPFSEAQKRATAIVALSGNNTLSFNGYAEISGIAFSAGSGSGTATIALASTANSANIAFNRCTLNVGSTGSAGRINIGITPSSSGVVSDITLTDTILQFAAAAQGVSVRNGRVRWRSTDSNLFSKVAGTTPTTLFVTGSTPCGAEIVCDGVDLSPISGTLVGAINAAQRYIFRNCKTHASLSAFAAAQAAPGMCIVESWDCDSGTTKGKHGRHGLYAGDVTVDFGVYRNAGGTLDGSTHYSWKMASNANAKQQSPLRSIELTKKNTTVGSPISPVVEIFNDGIDLTTGDIFVDWYYMGSSANVASYIATTYPGRLDAGTAPAITTSAETWTNAAGTPKPQKISATFTPQEAGLLRAIVSLLRASTTVYVDPKM